VAECRARDRRHRAGALTAVSTSPSTRSPTPAGNTTASVEGDVETAVTRPLDDVDRAPGIRPRVLAHEDQMADLQLYLSPFGYT